MQDLLVIELRGNVEISTTTFNNVDDHVSLQT